MPGRSRFRLLMAAFASLLVAALLPLLPVLGPAWAGVPAGGMSAAALNTMVNRYGDTSGRWSGADSTASVKLPDGRVAWLFSDTFLGAVNPDHTRPRSAPFIKNSMVVQDGTELVKTVHGGTTSVPDALVKPAQAGQFLWVGDGTVESGALKVLYNRYQSTGTGVLDVKLAGTALATFDPAGPTLTGLTDLPLGDGIGWGSAILEDGGYTYVYGTEHAENITFAHLARVSAGGLGGPWQFWTGTGWSNVESSSVRLLSGVGTAFGVQRVDGRYVLVTQESNLVFNPTVVAYTAASPTGPWTDAVPLFTTPEPQPASAVITYDTRFHPELATTGKLLVSYNVNSLAPNDVYADARIYRPRFVDVDWPRPVPDPTKVPPAPAGLTAAADPNAGTIRLAWQPVGGAQYWVYQRDVTAGQTHFARHPGAVTEPSFTAGLLRAGHTYEFRVAAANAVGEGPATATVSVLARIDTPAAPTGLTATAADNGRVTVSWTAVPGAWYYELFRRDVTAGEPEFSSAAKPGGAEATVAVDGLEHNHEYEFRLTANNGAGASPPSGTVRATARYAPPATPNGLTVTANPNGTITLRWDSAGDNVWYLIFQRDVTAGESQYTQLPWPITTCCEMTAAFLSHEHRYEYAIAATNRAGVSAKSTPAAATARFPTPERPANLRAVAGAGRVQLSWDGNPDYWYWVYQRDVTAGQTGFTRLPTPVTNPSLNAQYLINGHEYEFRVSGLNQAGEGPASATVRATPQVPLPGRPTGLTAVAQPDGSVALTWQSAGDDVWYLVYQRDRTAGEDWRELPLPVTTCCALGARFLTHNHEYEFKVVATNPAGVGPASDVAGATSRYARPAAPANLRGRAAGDGSVDLDWDGPDGTYYWVSVREARDGAPWVRSGIPTDQTHASWGSLRHGQAYEFRVTAENPGGESPASNVVTITSYGGLPSAPSGLEAVAGDGRVTLSWAASSSPNVLYQVYQRDLDQGESWHPLPSPAGCCGMLAQFLVNGHRYEFKVAALNASGESGTSNVAGARPMPPLPAAPSGLSAAAGDGVVTLRWTASPSPGVWYWIEYRPGGGDWQRAPYPVTTCCAFTLSYLQNGTTYDFRIRSTNISGDSAPTNVASATPLPPLPEAPSGLSVEGGDRQLILTWTPSPSPNVWYWIDYRLSGGPWQRMVYPLTTCCRFTVTGLVNGGTYDFRVSATNIAGVSAPSNVAGAVPMPPPPETPRWLVASGGGDQITLTWQVALRDDSVYRVYYRNLSLNQPWWQVRDVSARSLVMWEFDRYGDWYEFKVSARNLSGESATSPTARAWIRPHLTSAVKRPGNEANGANTLAYSISSDTGVPCEYSPYYQIVCFGYSPGGDRPMTIGDVLFYPNSKDAFYAKLQCESKERLRMLENGSSMSRVDSVGPNLLPHELVHSYQWAQFTYWWQYTLAYATNQTYFEYQANPFWGGYLTWPGVNWCPY